MGTNEWLRAKLLSHPFEEAASPFKALWPTRRNASCQACGRRRSRLSTFHAQNDECCMLKVCAVLYMNDFGQDQSVSEDRMLPT